MKIVEMKQFLEEFSKTACHSAKAPTVMEICRYTHYEKVCSNILAFYLSPDNQHGLGDLVLKTILSLMGTEIEIANVTVDTEFSLGGKFIDIVVKTNSFILGIENKIFHTLNNPFKTYAEGLKKIAEDEGKVVFKALLGLNVDEGEKYPGEFIPIKYETFFGEIRSKIGEYIQYSDQKYLTFFIDFINSLEGLTKGVEMDRQEKELFKDKEEFIVAVYNKIVEYQKVLKEQVERVKVFVEKDVDKKICDIGLYRPGIDKGLKYVLVINIKGETSSIIAVDSVLSPNGWVFEIFPRKQKKIKFEELKRMLEAGGVDYKETKNKRCAVNPNLDFDALPEDVASTISTFIKKLYKLLFKKVL